MRSAFVFAPFRAVIPVVLAALGACAGPVAAPPDHDRDRDRGLAPSATAPIAAAVIDPERAACQARIALLSSLPELPGAPDFEARRVEILGRARGEPMVFAREPASIADDKLPPAWLASRRLFDQGRPGARVGKLRGRHRHEPEALRALLLREGYAYTSEPLDALDLVSQIFLADLFAEAAIWLQRGAETRQLRREVKRAEIVYRYVDGPLAGRAADLLFGDRVAVRAEEIKAPLHRDLRALAEAEGFDRARIERRAEPGLVADLRFGDQRVRALLASDGAALRLECLDASGEARAAVQAFRAADAPRRRALARMHEVVSRAVGEAFRFDRPEGEKSPDRDGELRPLWASAYRSGRTSFEHDGATYAVFDSEGNAWPPEVCVDFVLDTFERTAGNWFRPRGPSLGRDRGRLDFDETGIPNRRGVLAFGTFAETQPSLFATRRFAGSERIEFRERARYFQFLTDHADEVRPGDVIAIHGMKQDKRIHQHAILVEYADPITGFPGGLADQMKRPRRRTWEGIMAEAPLRSLLYRARPTAEVFAKLDPG
jgi:hypothetical protein